MFAVVREQIVRALANNSSQGNFDSFRQRLSHLTYQDIVILWQQDRRNREELESQAKPIVYSICFYLFCFSSCCLANCIDIFKDEMVLISEWRLLVVTLLLQLDLWLNCCSFYKHQVSVVVVVYRTFLVEEFSALNGSVFEFLLFCCYYSTVN